MTKRIVALTALILFGISAAAQTVPPHNTLSATIKDANGHPYSRAFYTVQLVDSVGRAIPGVTRATFQGQPVSPTLYSGSLDTSGTFSIAVVPNNATGLFPQTTKWQISISAPNSMYLYNDARSWSLQYTATITADTDLSSQLSALAQPVSYIDVNGPSAFLQPVYGVTPTDPRQLATKDYVDAAVGSQNVVQSGTQYQIPYYTTSLFPQVGPSRVTVDGTGNNLAAPGTVTAASITATGLGTSTSPVCPNGSGGALTTSGCAVGLGTVNAGSSYRFAAYPSASATAVNPTTNIASDSSYSGVYLGGITPPSGFVPGIFSSGGSYNPNSEINVMAAGAKGDCVTDDHDAIERAIAAAAPTGSAQALPLYFPRPPGGCYLTSTLTWQGVSMRGETFGASFSAASKLSSMPGQDLWLFPDPKDVTTTVYSKNPKVSHMVWYIDDTVDVSSSHPHRKPGRTVYDGATTSGSRTVTSNTVICSGGDVGQGMLITYADTTTQSTVITSCAINSVPGNPGKTMTIASITPVASTTTTIQPLSVVPTPNQIIVANATGIAVGQIALVPSFPTTQEVTVTAVAGTTITLSANNQCVNHCDVPLVPAKFYDPTFTATETQTSTQLYVSLAGIPVTETMGNCALAMDNRDGTSTAGAYSIILNFADFENLDIQGKTGTQINKSGGFCLQGVVGTPYGTTWRNVRIGGLVYGLVSYQQDVSPGTASQGGDFNYLTNLNISATHPIIWYNGQTGRIEQVQTSGTAHTGLQLMGATSTTYAGPINWLISVPEQEQGAGTINLRLEGRGHVVTNLGTSASGGTVWAANNSKCISCVPRGTLSGTPGFFLVTGIQNDIDISDNVNLNPIADDMLLGNRITGLRATSASFTQVTRPVMLNQQRECKSQANSANFLFGSASEPYLNNCDLWFWAQDFAIGSGQHPPYVPDPTVQNGYYMVFNVANNGVSITGTTGPTPNITIGKNIPTKKSMVYIEARCPNPITFTITPRVLTASGTNTALTSQSIACTSTWTVLPAAAFITDLSPYSGYHFNLQLTGLTDEVDIAWFALVPVQDNYNGYIPENPANKNVANGYAGLDSGSKVLSANLPVASATVGAIKSVACSAGNAASGSFAGDGTPNCVSLTSLPNTLGCLQGFDSTPCVVAKLGTTYSSTSTSPTTTWYTNATGGPVKLHFMGMSHVTVVGTAGTMQFELGITGAANECVGNSGIGLTSTATKQVSSVNTNGCTVILQNGEILSWTLLLTGATGTPTVEVYAYAERME